MKVLIWFLCILVASAIKVLVAGSGSMEGIPTMILYGAMFAVAGGLCKAWDNRKSAQKTSADISLHVDEIVDDAAENTLTEIVGESQKCVKPPVAFCRKCGYTVPEDSAFCQHCGEKLISASSAHDTNKASTMYDEQKHSTL